MPYIENINFLVIVVHHVNTHTVHPGSFVEPDCLSMIYG